MKTEAELVVEALAMLAVELKELNAIMEGDA